MLGHRFELRAREAHADQGMLGITVERNLACGRTTDQLRALEAVVEFRFELFKIVTGRTEEHDGRRSVAKLTREIAHR